MRKEMKLLPFMRCLACRQVFILLSVAQNCPHCRSTGIVRGHV